ncbi:MAG: Na+/H+ antiporter NhaC family protein [Candidatus Cryptobacteroides sp.]
MEDKSERRSGGRPGKMNGWLALSPLALFLAIFLLSSLIAGDFYSVPVTVAFVVASAYSIIITKGPLADRIGVFSKGAGESNILLMVWIFILAGAFASAAKAIGSVESTVNLTLYIIPHRFLLAGLFLSACLISMSIGSSVGTIVALIPIAGGIAGQASLPLSLVAALIVGGSFFGDNLSFISDTTIAATTSQGCSMKDKFRVNIGIAGPAALLVAVIYTVIGLEYSSAPVIGEISPLKLIPYFSVILLAFCGVNVLTVLAIGVLLCIVIGLCCGTSPAVLAASLGEGIAGMGDLVIVTLLAGGMLEVIRHNGGLDFIIRGLTGKIRGRKGAEFSIAALVGISNLCTANNTIAILTVGKIAKEITQRFGLDPRKSASILNVFSCVIQCVIPYGAQLLMASSLTGLPATSIIPWLFYPAALLLTACLSIVFNFPRKKRESA